MKILLGLDEINPDKPDDEGRTPLWGAALFGNVVVAKMLLERAEVNPDKPDNNGITPLGSAAGIGHVGMVKILLEQDKVNLDGLNNDISCHKLHKVSWLKEILASFINHFP